MSQLNEEKENTSTDADLKKALTFLLSKEMKEYSLEKRKEFLLKKLPSNIVEKAFDLYQTIETNVNKNIEEILKQNQNNKSQSGGFLSSLLDFGIISTVLLSSLGINYLLDLNRNKKNEMFYREVEKKLNEELSKNIKEMKNEINSQLLEYVPANSLKTEINNQIVDFTQQRGLNLNLSSKSLREDIIEIKKNSESTDKKIKDLNVRIDNNNLLLKQDMIKELENLIEENNKKILIKIIENQNKLLAMTNSTLNIQKGQFESIKDSGIYQEKPHISTNDKNNPAESITQFTPSSAVNIRSLRFNNSDVTPTYFEMNKPETKIDDTVSKNDILGVSIDNQAKESNKNEDNLNDPEMLLESILSSVEKDNDKFALIKQLKNQLSRITEMSNENKLEPYYVNLTNKIYQKANSDKLKEFLLKSGFKSESSSKLVYDINRNTDLEKANLVIEEYESKLEN